MTVEKVIEQAIEEWSTLQGGPNAGWTDAGLAQHIATRLTTDITYDDVDGLSEGEAKGLLRGHIHDRATLLSDQRVLVDKLNDLRRAVLGYRLTCEQAAVIAARDHMYRQAQALQ